MSCTHRTCGTPPTASPDAVQTGIGETLAPPDCVTAEAALLRDIDHCIHMADLWLVVNRHVSQDLLDHLAERARSLRTRIESGGRRVPAGPGDSGESRWATPGERAVHAHQGFAPA